MRLYYRVAVDLAESADWGTPSFSTFWSFLLRLVISLKKAHLSSFPRTRNQATSSLYWRKGSWESQPSAWKLSFIPFFQQTLPPVLHDIIQRLGAYVPGALLGWRWVGHSYQSAWSSGMQGGFGGLMVLLTDWPTTIFGDLLPDQGWNPGLAVKTPSPNPWTARQFPGVTAFWQMI